MTRKKPTAKYTPTTEDGAALERWQARQAAAAPLPRVKLKVVDGVGALSSDYGSELHALAHQMNALGLDKPEQFTSILTSLTNVTARGDEANSSAALNEALMLMAGIAPRNPTEAMLAAQMAAVHLATMGAATRARGADTLEGRAINLKAINNFARTFAMQAETLKKLRSGGDQKVVVEHKHIYVYPGAQAVVGTLNQSGGGGVETKTEDQPHEREQLLLPERLAVLGDVEADGLPVPSASDDGMGSMPPPRRPRRRTAGVGER